MANRTDAAERLLNLVIALTNTRRPMTKEQIRASVAGYDPESDEDSFNRMFERDKDLLRRELGIPIETVPDLVHGDTIGYRVNLAAAEMPPVELTAAEIGALGVAASLWADAALAAEAERALVKLRALGYRPQAHQLAGIAARVPAAAAAQFEMIVQAIGERRALSFTYRAASNGQVSRRRVEPWRLRSRGRAWYLAAWDRDRVAERVFRLSRIEGSVKLLGEPAAFTRPDPDQIRAAFATVDPTVTTRLAGLALLPGQAALLRSRGHTAAPDEVSLTGQTQSTVQAAANRVEAGTPNRDQITVEYSDLTAFAVELAGYGAAVVVLDPPELREAALAHLLAAAELHDPTKAVIAPIDNPQLSASGAKTTDQRSGLSHSTGRTLDRMNRLLALVAYLASGEVATVAQLAAHFGVTPVQIRQDISLLWVTGVPGYMPDDLLDFAWGESDDDDVVLINDQQLGRPLRLAPTEAVALAAALRALIGQPELGERAAAASALDKLTVALGGATDWAESVQANLAAAPAPPLVATLVAAIRAGRTVQLDYVSAGDRRSQRLVDPLQVRTDQEHWLLGGWDRTANAVRTFRVDRILAARVTEFAADPHDSPTFDFVADDGAGLATLRFSAAARWLAEDTPAVAAIEALPDGETRLTVSVASPGWLRSLLLGWAPDVWAEGPADLRQAIYLGACEALAAYGVGGISDDAAEGLEDGNTAMPSGVGSDKPLEPR